MYVSETDHLVGQAAKRLVDIAYFVDIAHREYFRDIEYFMNIAYSVLHISNNNYAGGGGDKNLRHATIKLYQVNPHLSKPLCSLVRGVSLIITRGDY